MASAVAQFRQQHYRRTLDEKVPMLGDRTPRQCVRTKQGRKQLVRWLKNSRTQNFGWLAAPRPAIRFRLDVAGTGH